MVIQAKKPELFKGILSSQADNMRTLVILIAMRQANQQNLIIISSCFLQLFEETGNSLEKIPHEERQIYVR